MDTADLEKHRIILEKLASGSSELTHDDTICLADMSFFAKASSLDQDSTNGLRRNSALVEGPDKLHYLVIDLLSQDRLMELRSSMPMSISLREFAHTEVFAKHLAGAVIRSSTDQEASFTPILPGQIWALKAFGQTHPAETVISGIKAFEAGSVRKVSLDLFDGEKLVGAPSEDFVPRELRGALSSHLKRLLGIENPKFCAFSDLAPGSLPALIYNYFPAGHPAESPGYALLPKLHPPGYDIRVARKEYGGIEDYMVSVAG